MAAAAGARRVCVVGGCGALGRAVVDSFAAAGWDTVSVDIRASDKAGASVVLPTDVGIVAQTDALDADPALSTSTDGGAAFDAVVCAAGGWAGGSPGSKGFAKSLEFMVAVNLVSAAQGARIAERHLKPSGLFALTGAFAAMGGTPGMAAYGMVKAGTHQLLKSMAEEGALPEGATAVCVMPITIDTPMNREGMPDADFSTWTPPAHFADKLLAWAQGAEAPPASGSLVKVETRGGATSFDVVA